MDADVWGRRRPAVGDDALAERMGENGAREDAEKALGGACPRPLNRCAAAECPKVGRPWWGNGAAPAPALDAPSLAPNADDGTVAEV